MSHERKKHGERKDKKNKRMHEDVEMRHKMAEARGEQPESDQHDVQGFKSGGPSDKINNPQARGKIGH